MRAELAAIEDPGERREFARSASRAAFSQGWWLPLSVAGLAALVAAVAIFAASRSQLAEGGPGVLPVTVLAPTPVIFLGALAAAMLTRSFARGVLVGFVACAASFVTVFVVVAIEGLVWMERHGVFVLDGDSPKQPVDSAYVVFDFITTGMFIGNIVLWVIWPVLGAVLGVLLVRGSDAWKGRHPDTRLSRA
jgi:hypothetical protein